MLKGQPKKWSQWPGGPSVDVVTFTVCVNQWSSSPYIHVEGVTSTGLTVHQWSGGPYAD